ncbi:hypothetical protein MKC54_10945 [[Clostridium] innocuum]|nr:hypothetical protein [[Clostridium] innocuum]MCR0577402.1 hypothetical protein [[Clostridium] innocuum]
MSRVVRLGKVSLTFDMLTTAQKQELTGPIGPIGPQGKQGVQGASLILKNDWVSGTAYKNDTTGIDTVSYQGSYYGCKKSHTASASITPANTTYWMLLAAKGSQGIQGIQGVKGADGAKILFGAGEPAAATGKQGDAYLNTSNWDTFSKTSATTWTLQGNMKGADGNAKVADNFTTIDPTYALSAPKGKELHERLSLIGNKNLLHNGDFQVNQRGQGEYSVTNSDLFTLDRWRIIGANATAKLTKLDNGVRLQNAGTGSVVLTQRIYIEKVSDYTIVINARNVVGNVIVEIYDMGSGYKTQNLKNGRNVIKVTNQSLKDITPTIVDAGSIEIEYVDLFEGTIAYSHVKEDYAIALMRCQRYTISIGGDIEGIINGGIFCVYKNMVRLFTNYNILEMRIVPTVAQKPSSITLYGTGANGNRTFSDFSLISTTNLLSLVDNEGIMNYPDGTMGLWQTSGGKIILDAEIR